MAFLSAKQIGIIYLDKSRLYLYDHVKKAIFQFDIKPEVGKDLEIINSSLLDTQVKSFLETNKLTPSSLIIVLAQNLIFEKDLTNVSKEQQEAEAQRFLDNIPFESVSSGVYKSEKEYRIVAANSYFIKAIKNAFEELGFVTAYVLPSFVFGNLGDSLKQETIKIILGKVDSVKQYNLLNSHLLTAASGKEAEEQKGEKTQSGEEKEKKEEKKTSKKNLTAIGIFVLFIIVLFVIVFIVMSII